LVDLLIDWQAYRAWVERNGEEQPLPGVDMTHNQLFFLKYAQVTKHIYLRHSHTCVHYYFSAFNFDYTIRYDRLEEQEFDVDSKAE